MKEVTPVKDRKNRVTPYHYGVESTEIPDVGSFPNSVKKVADGGIDVDAEYALAAITIDFVYFVDEEESDQTNAVIMVNRQLQLVSDNFFASDSLSSFVASNESLLWISEAIQIYQKEEFVRTKWITAEVSTELEKVDEGKLTEEERRIYLAYLTNGPVKYSKPESLMAVLSADLHQEKYSDQLSAILELLY